MECVDMDFLKAAAIWGINTATQFKGSRAVSAVRKMIGVYSVYTQWQNTPEKTKDFYDVLAHGCHSVKKSQHRFAATSFSVAMFYQLNNAAYREILKQIDDIQDHYDGKYNVVERLNGLVRDNKNYDSEILDRTLNGLLAVGTRGAYIAAIDLLGRIDKYADILIDHILKEDTKDKLDLLSVFWVEGNSPHVNKKIFAALCELSKSEDFDMADDAQDTAVLMFYARDDDGQYEYIADLAPVLEQVSKSTPSPKSLMPLFEKVVNRRNGLEDFIEARTFRNNKENSSKLDTTIDLWAAFKRIDRDNGNKGLPTPLSAFYQMVDGVVAAKQKVDQARVRVFNLDNE